MTLREKIEQDFKEAFKAKEEARVSVLRLLLAAIKNRELEKRTKLSKSEPAEKLPELSKLTDEEIISVLSGEVKKRKEAIDQYKQGGREELAQKEKIEMEILAVYLPEQMTEEEIKKLAKEAIEKVGASGVSDLGKVMKVLMPLVKGKTDGNLVNKIVKEELESN